MAKKKKKKRKKVRSAKSKPKTRRLKKTRKKSKKTKKARKTSRTKRKTKKFYSKALNISKDSDGNSIIKVSDSWANQAYVNESKYKKKYKLSMINFGPKKEKELVG